MSGTCGGGMFLVGLTLLLLGFLGFKDELTKSVEPCIVDGFDPFRGAWMHLKLRPNIKCTSEDDKTDPPVIGTELTCLVTSTASGNVCIGGKTLHARKAGAWTLIALSSLFTIMGAVIAVLELVAEHQRTAGLVQEFFPRTVPLIENVEML